MSTQISKEHLTELNRFSNDHKGCTTRIEITQPGGSAQVVAENLPLVGVSLNGKEDGVNVIVGDRASQNYEHNISGPASVSVENNCLVIRSNDGSVTRVCCTSTHP